MCWNINTLELTDPSSATTALVNKFHTILNIYAAADEDFVASQPSELDVPKQALNEKSRLAGWNNPW